MPLRMYANLQAFTDAHYGECVRVYYNPNSHYERIVVKALRNSRWVNVHKPSYLALTDVTFHVIESTRKKVANHETHSCCAYIAGRVTDWTTPTADQDVVTFDPYKAPYWGFRNPQDLDFERHPIERAPGALINRNYIYI